LSNRRTGAHSMKHALAWAHHTYGPASVLHSMPSVVWIYDKKTNARRPISHREDLFGVADLLILRAGRPLLVQVTTMPAHGKLSGAGVHGRKRKAEAWLQRDGEYRCSFWVIAWKRREHFRCWYWDGAKWGEYGTFWSPADTSRYLELKKSQARRLDLPEQLAQVGPPAQVGPQAQV
jgi:hypothetical protein